MMKGNKHMKTTTNILYPAFPLFAFACFALAPQVRGVCQDACLTNQNTVQGDDVLFSLTTGFGDTAIGFQALYSNTSGHGNNAVGVQALYSNIDGNYNTAIGHSALAANTSGSLNTANGVVALWSNTTGDVNTAIGVNALYSNTTGSENTATGFNALLSNTTGDLNTATGQAALRNNTTGISNTATGSSALRVNTTGSDNTAIGHRALDNNPTGSSNIALGFFAGTNLTKGDNNIDIGNRGVAAESNTIRIGTVGTQTKTFIAGISGVAVMGPPVHVSSSGQLGAQASSRRFKEQIKPMGNASEAILGLKPVTFRYKQEIDPEHTPEFGLVAEDVDKVNPDLVVRDADGKAYTVRYEAVNAMLLNEFLKEHRKVQEQGATIAELKSTAAKQEMINAQQQREVKALAATLRDQASQIQKVRAQLELTKAPTQTVVNNQ